MKKSIILGLVIAGTAALTSCNHFLDKNRFPLDEQTDTPSYWTSAQNVQAQINTLYNNFTGYGNGQSWVNDFYYQSLSDDQCSHIYSGEGTVFARWTYEAVPNANSVWDASYTEVRRCNEIINNCNIANKVENDNYVGQARLIRAMQYYELVRALGDVPLVTEVLNTTSPELYGERTPRNQVMDFVLEDLDFAIAHILKQKDMQEISIDLANAMKSEICLYEASYSRYHKADEARAEKFYREAIKACKAIMSQGYTIGSDYRALYNSVFTADASTGTVSILANPEVIFAKCYETGSLCHSAASFLSAETEIPGMTKDAFDSYLFRDGKPLCSTTLAKTDVAEPVLDAENNITGFDISKLLEVRDARLEQTIDPTLAFGSNISFARPNSYNLKSTTGYTICKYVNPNIPLAQVVNANTNFTCAPIYWLAQIYCDYLEARAELKELDDADVTMCVKPLWDRAKIDTSNLNKAYLENMNDIANNMGISSLLWEVRRLRRSEMMFDRNHRYWDLVRWHKLDLLDTNEHPNIALGANVSLANETALAGVFTTNGYINGAASTAGTSVRVFSDREYLQPLGSDIIRLYNDKGIKLNNNPGW